MQNVHPEPGLRRVLKAGRIQFGPSSVDCTIRSVSDTGAQIMVTSPLWFPDVFNLTAMSDGSSRPCHVVSREGRYLAVKFDD